MSLNVAPLTLLDDITQLASSGCTQFSHPIYHLIQRPVFRDSSVFPHLLAVIAKNGELEKAGYTLEKLRGNLQVIKGHCKLQQETIDDEKRPLIQALIANIKKAIILLTPKEEKHLVSVATVYSKEIVDLVGVDESLVLTLKEKMSVTEGTFTLPVELANQLDDKLLARLLKEVAEKAKEVTKINFADYPLLSIGAPALLLKACPKITLESVDESRFQDQKILFTNGNEKQEIRVNKGLVLHHSPFFTAPFASSFKVSSTDPTVIRVEVPDVQGAISCIEHMKNMLTPLYDMKSAVSMYYMADYFLCAAAKELALNSLLTEFEKSPQDVDYSDFHHFPLPLKESAFYERFSEALRKKIEKEINNLDITLTETQRTILLLLFTTRELKKMSAVDGFPFPPDLPTRLNLVALDPTLLPKTFAKLVQILQAITPKEATEAQEELASLNKIELPKQQTTSSSPLSEPSMQHIDLALSLTKTDDASEKEGILQEMQKNLEILKTTIFIQKITQEVEELHPHFSKTKIEQIKLYFASDEIRGFIAKGEPLPQNLIEHLELRKYFDTLDNETLNIPKELESLLIMLQKSDAAASYLLAKIALKAWKNAAPHFMLARGRFEQALKIDPDFEEAREELEKLPKPPITIPRPDLFNDRFFNINQLINNIFNF